MLIVRLEHLSLSYGSRVILNDISLSLNDGEKIGLIGPNGAGKSSLLKILVGQEKPNAGERILRRGITIAYLSQEYKGEGGATPLAAVLSGRPDILELERQLEEVEAQLTDPAIGADMDAFGRVLAQQAAILDKHAELGGPRLRNEARGLLERLGLSAEMHERPVGLLSGGQLKMVGLARCMISQPDLLLLDEPDNHLDLAGKARLEEVLQTFEGAIILISHDRYLLDDTISHIVELDRGRITEYEGNYSSYTVQRELALLKQQQDFISQQKEITRLEEAVARFKLWASLVVDERHIKQARNKQRQIDRMDKVERPVLVRRTMNLRFKAGERGGQKVIEVRHLAKAYDENLVLLDVAFTLMRGERVGIVGRNGCGKSVLFRLLLGQDAPTDGEVWVGPSIRLGYYAQQHETLDPKQTPIDVMRDLRPMTEGEAVALLGRFLFSYQQVHDPIGQLSGGEKSRLQLSRLMYSGVNALLLDEPTNHLDIASTEVLEDALNAFDGTLLTISHDRYFLDRTCTRILELEDGEVREYQGGYSDYVAQKQRRLEAEAVKKVVTPAPKPVSSAKNAVRR